MTITQASLSSQVAPNSSSITRVFNQLIQRLANAINTFVQNLISTLRLNPSLSDSEIKAQAWVKACLNNPSMTCPNPEELPIIASLANTKAREKKTHIYNAVLRAIENNTGYTKPEKTKAIKLISE
jgi:Mg2+/Co2+ transporter CorB